MFAVSRNLFFLLVFCHANSITIDFSQIYSDCDFTCPTGMGLYSFDVDNNIIISVSLKIIATWSNVRFRLRKHLVKAAESIESAHHPLTKLDAIAAFYRMDVCRLNMEEMVCNRGLQMTLSRRLSHIL